MNKHYLESIEFFESNYIVRHFDEAAKEKLLTHLDKGIDMIKKIRDDATKDIDLEKEIKEYDETYEKMRLK